LPGTKVILMGVERIRSLAESLVAGGMKPNTPVGMVRWGTTGRQQSIEGTLATIADIVAAKDFKAPAVTIIGGVVKLRGLGRKAQQIGVDQRVIYHHVSAPEQLRPAHREQTGIARSCAHEIHCSAFHPRAA